MTVWCYKLYVGLLYVVITILNCNTHCRPLGLLTKIVEKDCSPVEKIHFNFRSCKIKFKQWNPDAQKSFNVCIKCNINQITQTNSDFFVNLYLCVGQCGIDLRINYSLIHKEWSSVFSIVTCLVVSSPENAD